jgi:hypothetical protein
VESNEWVEFANVVADWLQLFLTLATGVATAVWAVWKLTSERKADRDAERKQLFALYVYPFLRACDDLQSRLYNILELNGLKPLRDREPEELSYAEETLYLISQYFGWERCLFRYGPYSQDSTVLRLTEAIRATFSTDFRGVGPFCFLRIYQKALGQRAVPRTEGSLGAEFETVDLFEFRHEIAAPQLAGSATIQETLEALRKAKTVDQLKGRWRLAEVQNYLVDLLEYIESLHRFTLFPGKREKADRHPDWQKWARKRSWDLPPPVSKGNTVPRPRQQVRRQVHRSRAEKK